MKVLLKSLGILLAVLVALLIIAVLALVFLFDPDVLEPRIEALARENNVALDIKGDMDWQFWPALAIEINDVAAAPLATPGQPLARVGRASLRVAVAPLFRRQVEVDHVVVEGAVIDLIVDKTGRGNWQSFMAAEPATTETPTPQPEQKAPTSTEPETAPEEGAQLQLDVDRISLRNSAVNFTSLASGPEAEQRLTAQDVQLKVEGFNLQAEPFAMTLQWQTNISDSTLFGEQGISFTGELAQRVQLANGLNEVNVTDGRLVVAIAGLETPVQLDYRVALRDLQDELRYQGEVELAPVNLKQLLTALGQEAPATTADYALTRLGAAGGFRGDTNAITVDPLSLTLDKTRVSGRVAVTDFSTGTLDLALQGDHLNVDDYLPPAPDGEPQAAPASTGDEVIIPLESIKPLSADVSVDFEQLTVASLPLQQLRLRLNAEGGLVMLEELSADLYDGTLIAKGTLDGRGDTALINFEGGVDALQLAPFMKDWELDEKLQLSGAVNAAAQGNSRGVTMNELMGNGEGQISFAGDKVRLAPLNVEEKFCEIVRLVSKEPANDEAWPAYTEMTELNGLVRLADKVVTVEQMSAGVAQLLMSVNGQVDLGAGSYNLGLPLTLTESRTSPDGCQVQSDFWLNRELSLFRCRGSLEGLSPVDDCRPDAAGLAELVRDFAAYQLKEKHGDKIEAAEQELEEKKDELRQKLQEELGIEEGQKVEDRLRQLFNR